MGAISRAWLSDFWTWPGWTPAGVLFSVLAAVAAVIAAIWAVRTFNQGRTAEQAASQRHVSTLRLTEQVQLEARLVRRVQQYERVHAGLLRLLARAGPEGQAELQAALAPFRADELPECWAVARTTVTYTRSLEGSISAALTEIDRPLSRLRKELAELGSPP